MAAGLIAAVNGGLNLGDPGTGNGVVGAAAALVLGLIAVARRPGSGSRHSG